MEKDNINYKSIVGCPDEKTLQYMIHLYAEIFEDADLDFFKQRIKKHPKLYSVLSYSNDELVGFKIGYPYYKTTFYSWIGGVKQEFRKQGIAQHLAFLQKQWVKENGFIKLKTKSMNRYKAMMILNLKNGFDVTKVYTNTKGQTKIVFEKNL